MYAPKFGQTEQPLDTWEGAVAVVAGEPEEPGEPEGKEIPWKWIAGGGVLTVAVLAILIGRK